MALVYKCWKAKHSSAVVASSGCTKNYAVARRLKDAAIFDRLVYDPGAKYSCLHVLQRPAILLKTGLCSGVDAVIKAYRLYLEQCPQPPEGPLLALTRAWTLVRFVESGLLELSSCNCCGGNFITHAHQPVGSFACSLCQPPSRAVKDVNFPEMLPILFHNCWMNRSNRLFNRNGVDKHSSSGKSLPLLFALPSR